jgi:hypothetical protein
MELIISLIAGSFLITFVVHHKNQLRYERKKRENQTKAAKEDSYQENGKPNNYTAST